MITKSSGVKKYSLIMIFGGAIGNLYDRIVFRAVPDFIDFHVGNFHWFIFNLADVFITLGVFFMILFEFAGNNKKKLMMKNIKILILSLFFRYPKFMWNN